MSPHSIRIRIYLMVLASVLVLGTAGFILLEGLNPVDAAYLVIATVSTVGYGDVHPVTAAGRILAIAVILTGVGSFVGLAANAIEYTLDDQAHKRRMTKLNMLIGSFFSESGMGLIRVFSPTDPDLSRIREELVVRDAWSAEDFRRVTAALEKYPFNIGVERVNLEALRVYLSARRQFHLQLLDNPVLFEHDRFTDILQAVFHLTEELVYRGDLTALPGTDLAHLRNDMTRAYGHLVREWLVYMAHLKEHYPYLFSLAMRTNPFDPSASAVVR